MFAHEEINFLLNVENTSRQTYDDLTDLYIDPIIAGEDNPITTDSFKEGLSES